MAAGLLDAPHGCAAIAFLQAAGVGALRAWEAAATADALALYVSLAAAELQAVAGSTGAGSGGSTEGGGGYLVEAADGLVLVAFTSPAAAVR